MTARSAQIASTKGLQFEARLSPGLPASIETDPKRLQQVLKNLLSNALKFTEHGSVTLTMETAAGGWSPDQAPLNQAEQVIAFRVADTGIGIPSDKHRIIFEAFQQADGTTSRRFGGTGLGLSISREIARLLGGEIRLTSEPGFGSTFVLYLPQAYVPARIETGALAAERGMAARAAVAIERAIAVDESLLAENDVEDDRHDLQPGDRVVLIVENDLTFASILSDLAHEKGFKCLAAIRGDVGLAMAKRYRPDAITLDIDLPGLDGWTVLDRLKHDPETRHIPVHIISMLEEGAQRGLRLGAMAYLAKPVEREALATAFGSIHGFIDRKVKNLLIVEDNDVERRSIVELIGNGDVKTTAVATGEEALAALESQAFDCLVLDLGLDEMSGFELLERMKASPQLSHIPVIVYTGRDLSKKQETELRRLAETIIIKDVKSPDRLLDETALFLHRVESSLPAEKRKMLEQVHQRDPALSGRRALIVDDDIRNIFALTSVLEQHDVEVVYAENGKDGLKMLEEHAGYRRRPDGRDDAGNGRLRGDAAHPSRCRAFKLAADHRAHREGDERRSREVHRGGRVRLHHQAGRHRSTALAAAGMALPLKRRPAGPEPESVEALELELLLEAVFRQYGYDFREYARTSMRRRIASILKREELQTISALQDRILHDPATWERFLQGISVSVSAIFRDPHFFQAFRRHAVPVLRTYPFIRIWQAGCSLGEEAYSLAILLQEEGLYDRSLIYATDINEATLRPGAGRHLSRRI